MKLVNCRSNTASMRMLCAAGAAIAISLLVQGGVIAQGVQPGYNPPGDPQYAPAGAPQYAAPVARPPSLRLVFKAT